MKRAFPFFAFLLFSLLLSGCASGYTTSSWPGVVVQGETAYLAYHAHVYAVNWQSGGEIWRYPKEADAARSFYAAPVLTTDGQQLIVSGYDNILYSLDPATGVEKWRFTQAKNRFVGEPLATEQGIYAPNSDGNLYALNFNGAPLWPAPFQTERILWARPSTNAECECLYVAAMDHHIYALNPADGSLIWKSEALGGAVASAPTYSEGRLYVGTFARQLVAVDSTTGKLIGQPFSSQGWVWGSPALNAGRLYFGDLSGSFYILNADGFASVNTIPGEAPIIAAPLVDNETVYVVSEGGSDGGVLQALDLNGNAQWKQTLKGKLYTTPVLADSDTLLIAITDGDAALAAFNRSGSPKWTFIPQK